LDFRARARHCRYFERGRVYHIISLTNNNSFLFRPDRLGELRKIVAGVLEQAHKQYGEVQNYGFDLLSNHLHALLAVFEGDPRVISDYMAYIKRHTTTRWREHVGWKGRIWGGYTASALVTPTAQMRAFKYVLAQGVKENLVARPQDWPGFHCAESLLTGEPVEGYWFNGTRYGKAKHAEAVKKNPKEILRVDFHESREFTFDKLPALAHLDDDAFRERVRKIVSAIIDEREKAYPDTPPLGVEAICAMDPMTSTEPPKPPWFEERKRMIVWDDPRKPEVADYLDRYWEHQIKFRTASNRWTTEQMPEAALEEALFPELSFVPGLRPRPIAHMEQSTL